MVSTRRSNVEASKGKATAESAPRTPKTSKGKGKGKGKAHLKPVVVSDKPGDDDMHKVRDAGDGDNVDKDVLSKTRSKKIQKSGKNTPLPNDQSHEKVSEISPSVGNAQNEDDDAPAEISSKSLTGVTAAAMAALDDADDNDQKAARKRKRHRLERTRLDPAILESVSSQISKNEVVMENYPKFEGKKTRLDDEEDMISEKTLPARKIQRTERTVMNGLKVKVQKAHRTPTLARTVPRAVTDFLSDHLYGSRVKRVVSGNRNRPRSGHYRPAKSFVRR